VAAYTVRVSRAYLHESGHRGHLISQAAPRRNSDEEEYEANWRMLSLVILAMLLLTLAFSRRQSEGAGGWPRGSAPANPAVAAPEPMPPHPREHALEALRSARNIWRMRRANSMATATKRSSI